MIYKVIENDRNIYSNTDQKHALCLPNYFKFLIPLQGTFSLNYIDLFFQVSENDTDPVSIELLINCRIIQYRVTPAEIKESSLRLLLDTHPTSMGSIGVSIKSSGVTRMWVNVQGPCVIVNGSPLREINLSNAPLISIVTPIFRTKLEYLRQTIESVFNQMYQNWELCLIDDGSKDKELSEYLSSLSDSRIHIRRNRNNRGIGYSTNVGIGMSRGDYVGFLDHDDLLTPDALLEVASAIDSKPHTKLIYSDEDKVKEDGTYVEPFYKPDFSYHMLLSQNYICHFSVYAKKVLENINGIRNDFEGSQDYDMVLRAMSYVNEGEIVHIPRVLYHWRVHEKSTSFDPSTKPYAHFNALRALRDHVGDRARVTVGRYRGTYQVDFVMPYEPSVNIIISTKDNLTYLKTCCFSIDQSTYSNYRVTIVDNGSQDVHFKRYLGSLSGRYKVLEYNKPFNFSAINNFAVENSEPTDLLLFLNDDTEVITKDWLQQMAQHIGRYKVEVVGAKLLYGDRKIQHAGVIIGIGGVAGHSHKYVHDSNPGYFSRPHIIQNLSAVTGACMMVSRRVFNEVGGFERRLPRAFNDIDFCLKVRSKGYKVVYTPHACLFHHESISRGKDNHKDTCFARAIDYMQKKWDCKNFKDPYYNPNLTLVDENFSFRSI